MWNSEERESFFGKISSFHITCSCEGTAKVQFGAYKELMEKGLMYLEQGIDFNEDMLLE